MMSCYILKLEGWKNNYFSYLDIDTSQQMLLGINNSVPYIDYLQKSQQQGHTILGFFTPVIKQLQNLTHILKKIKMYIGSGCRVCFYNNKQISYQIQAKVITKSNNSSSYIKQLLRNSGI